MKVKQLQLTNFRGFAEYSIEFADGLNLLAGENGAGKSTVLDAIGLMLHQIVNRLKHENASGAAIPESNIRAGACELNIRLSFQADGKEVCFSAARTRVGYSRVGMSSNYKELTEWTRTYRDARANKMPMKYPLLAHYRVNRAVLDIPKRQASATDTDALSCYEGALSGNADFRHFFAWYRDQEDYENEQLRYNKAHVDPSLEAVRSALRRVLPEIRDIHVRRRPQAMVATKNGVTIEISQLSDGEKCYLALVGDIACRMARLNANETVSADVILASPGVVLIDELDLHLHPSWQREAIRKLPLIFPNIQFIVTTHSPQMIGEVSPDRVQYCKPGMSAPEKHPNALGLKSGEILEMYMATREMNADVQQLERDFHTALDMGKFDLAESTLKKLRADVPNAESLPLYERLLTELNFMR